MPAIDPLIKPKPRVSFNGPVKFKSHALNENGYAANVSESGMFVQTNTPPAVGEKVKINFQFSEGHPEIDTICEIVWVKPFEPVNIDGMIPGFGARFVGLASIEIESIRTYVYAKAPHSVTETPTAKQNGQANHKTSLAVAMQIPGSREKILGFVENFEDEEMNFYIDSATGKAKEQLKRFIDYQMKTPATISAPVRLTLHPDDESCVKVVKINAVDPTGLWTAKLEPVKNPSVSVGPQPDQPEPMPAFEVIEEKSLPIMIWLVLGAGFGIVASLFF